jgi:hypothetical protein
VLLLKCKDAIETLHLELEEERAGKERLLSELQEAHRLVEEMRL